MRPKWAPDEPSSDNRRQYRKMYRRLYALYCVLMLAAVGGTAVRALLPNPLLASAVDARTNK
jgi:hypothetical protein